MTTTTAFPNFDATQSYMGHCQVCGNRQVVNEGTMVLHGYLRPGHGYIEGRCPGERYAPFELSCEVAKSHLKYLIEDRIPSTKKHIADLKADKVEEFYVSIATGYEYSGRGRFGGNAKRTYTMKLITRGYVHVKEGQYDYDGGNTFDHYRKERLYGQEQTLKQMEEDVKSLSGLIKRWKYSPEKLVLREAAEAEEKAIKDARASQKLLARNWKELWKNVADAIRNHKDGRAWRTRGLGEAVVEAWMQANPFPTDKERMAARKGVK